MGLVWKVKLIVEGQTDGVSEVEVGRFERHGRCTLGNLGLTLAESKEILGAIQREMVGRQVMYTGEIFRGCQHCRRQLATKGYYRATFLSLFGDVPIRVRRLLGCACRYPHRPSFSAVDLENQAIAPELQLVTAKFAALVPFAKVATIIGDLLPCASGHNAGTVRNRTMAVGRRLLQAETHKDEPSAAPAPASGPIIVGLDGGYVRNRHPRRNAISKSSPARSSAIPANSTVSPSRARERSRPSRPSPAGSMLPA